MKVDKSNKPRDKFGRDLKVGDFIAYGTLGGRCAFVRIGKVLKIQWIETSEDWGTLEHWQFCVVGVDDSWEYLNLCDKKGYLQYPERCIILPRESIRKEYLDLLDPVTFEAKLEKHDYLNKKKKTW